MNLLDMLDNMENNNTTLEQELNNQESFFKDEEETMIENNEEGQNIPDINTLNTLEPKEWFKFEDENDLKDKLKDYKSLIKKPILKYKKSDVIIYPCTIVGYIDYPKNENYDVLVIQLGEKLHCIRTAYLVEMQ